MIDDMHIGCHPVITDNEVIDASKIENYVPHSDVHTVAGNSSYEYIELKLPSILCCDLFSSDRDSHVAAKSKFRAESIVVGRIDIIVGVTTIKPGTCGTNFIIGGSFRNVKMQ